MPLRQRNRITWSMGALPSMGSRATARAKAPPPALGASADTRGRVAVRPILERLVDDTAELRVVGLDGLESGVHARSLFHRAKLRSIADARPSFALPTGEQRALGDACLPSATMALRRVFWSSSSSLEMSQATCASLFATRATRRGRADRAGAASSRKSAMAASASGSPPGRARAQSRSSSSPPSASRSAAKSARAGMNTGRTTRCTDGAGPLGHTPSCASAVAASSQRSRKTGLFPRTRALRRPRHPPDRAAATGSRSR